MHDEVPERNADLIRAAEAAASWVRARRASWTTAAPAGLGATAPAVAPPDAPPDEERPDFDVPAMRPEFRPGVSREFDAPVSAAEFGHAAPPFFEPVGAAESGGVSVADRIGAIVRRLGGIVRTVPPSVIRRGALTAGALALGTVVFLGGRSVWRSLPTRTSGASPAPTTAPTTAPKTPPAVEPAAGRAAASARKAVGSVRITTNPAAARVTVDGKPHGVTPVTVGDLSPGNHDVALVSSAGTVRRTVTVVANQTVQLDESIFSGWLAVYAPFEIVIAEANRVLRPDERGQVLLPPGMHDLRVSNRTLGYEATWNVEIKPGATTNLRVTPAPSKLTVTSPEPAEVWVDGTKVGDTPLNAAAVPLGTHEVLVKRAGGAERRYTITVGVKPFTLNADF